MSYDNKRKYPLTELNKYDRKILDKYTKLYSNFIESNTAENDVLGDKRYKGKE